VRWRGRVSRIRCALRSPCVFRRNRESSLWAVFFCVNRDLRRSCCGPRESTRGQEKCQQSCWALNLNNRSYIKAVCLSLSVLSKSYVPRVLQ
jgi:hypothetical protein